MAEQYPLRRAEPGQVFTYTGEGGRQINLKADDEGIVAPRNQTEVRVLDGYDLPVARKAEAERKADEKPDKSGGKT